MELNAKCKTVKHLKENKKEHLDDLGYGNDFLYTILLDTIIYERKN